MKLQTIRHDRIKTKGNVLALLIVISAALAALSMTYLGVLKRDIKRTVDDANTLIVRTAAESGIELALWELDARMKGKQEQEGVRPDRLVFEYGERSFPSTKAGKTRCRVEVLFEPGKMILTSSAGLSITSGPEGQTRQVASKTVKKSYRIDPDSKTRELIRSAYE